MENQTRIVHVPDTPYLVFFASLTVAFVVLGFAKSQYFFVAAVLTVPLCAFFFGTTVIGPQYVSRRTWKGSQTMFWKNVSRMDVLPNFYCVVLYGNDGARLAFPGPAVMDSKRDDLPAWYLEELAEGFDIPIRLNWAIVFVGSNDT